MTLLVIYDPDREFAAVVEDDPDAMLVPTMVGPTSASILQAFVDAIGDQTDGVPARDLTLLFQGFLARNHEAVAQALSQAAQGQVEQERDGPLVEAARAEREAQTAGSEPPEPAPADPDVEATPRPADQVIDCPNCQGTGVIPNIDTGQPEQCGMCLGKGKLTLSVMQ